LSRLGIDAAIVSTYLFGNSLGSAEAFRMHQQLIIIAAIALTVSGCAVAYSPRQRSPAYQPNSAGIYPSSGTAAGWEDYYARGFGYANPVTDPGPAGAGR
jgi:hypothetical protein